MAKYFGVGDDVPFQVYITPLDNRETTGEWVSFPTTPENLRDVFARMEIGPSDWSIANVEAHIYGIRDVIWHCDSLDELNYLAAKLEELDEDQLKMTVAGFREYAWDIEDDDPNFSNGILTALDRCLREM